MHGSTRTRTVLIGTPLLEESNRYITAYSISTFPKVFIIKLSMT